ncbi:phosphoenolpyruvate synthase [Sporocytophaga myxococcoides]|uniref:Phosphoenolpyruvate synthase n=2 Tax=Sporocytophaga myxococcoides TaxID=153721 RepID=A0A098LMP1_9BACT|nr:phosphoenolpyruvate synthase [Sporocytophaga myxococcoides]
MFIIRHDQQELIGRYTIGGKAENLFRMKASGFNVPDWVVIPDETLSTTLFNQTVVDDSRLNTFAATIVDQLSGTEYFAVRSSAIGEDGADYSFAGMFESFLYVPSSLLGEYIIKVYQTAKSERLKSYCQANNIHYSGKIAVIVQQMIGAEVAGVAFGINPIDGDHTTKVINAVYGLGEGLVSGELNADTYFVKEHNNSSVLAEKTNKKVFDGMKGKGIVSAPLSLEELNNPTLNENNIKEISAALTRLEKELGKTQDIEFAYSQNQLYLLQTRPVTKTKKNEVKKDNYILWDNSNIIESYPGVTTPLTFSFISKSYEGAYRLFAEFLGVDIKIINEHESVFANTLGLINGRVYYNLKSWYHMLALLPGYSINARFMEKMMGVKERFDIPESYQLSRTTAWWRIIKMASQMYGRYLSLPKRRKQFVQLVNETIATYKQMNYDSMSSYQLMQAYIKFEKTLLNEWKAPLLNDFFAMIWFGMLQKQCTQYKISSNPNIHNDLLCGSSDIISVQPIHRSIQIATIISADPKLKELFAASSPSEIWQIISTNSEENLQKLKLEIDQYIDDFGERCIGELKLESISYTQDPTGFIRLLKSYIESAITAESISGKTEELIRKKAEEELNKSIHNSFFKKYRIRKTLKKARDLVSARENLRYERTRAFGVVREIFTHIGKRFYSDNIIESTRDIFYLTKEEIFAYIEGRSVSSDLKSLIRLRKCEYEKYSNSPVPSERFATYGAVYHSNDFFSTAKSEPLSGALKGIGCCPGRVKAKVRVISQPDELSSLEGDILVTSSTDPGWVTLFPSASGIIVERGSLLSHSAIVSREMGKPCIVSVSGLMKTLKTGDVVEMDGSTGEISIIRKVS